MTKNPVYCCVMHYDIYQQIDKMREIQIISTMMDELRWKMVIFRDI